MKKKVVDHLGRTVTYEFPPKRIVSLCPGITETICALHLEGELVGRTRFCKYPEEHVQTVEAVAGTKDFNLEKIHAVQPDLIILEKEENTLEMMEALAEHYPVYVAEVQSIDDAYRMITDLGELTDRTIQAEALANQIKECFSLLPIYEPARVAYVIWRKPYMAVGRDTYINSVLNRLGFTTPLSQSKDRYPALTEEDFQNANLDLVLLSSEPYPFKEKQVAEFQAMLPNTKILLIDGEMFWYGARMLKGAEYLQSFDFQQPLC